MINAILKGIFSLITGLINLLLSPIDLIISSSLPGLNSALNSVGAFLSVCMRSIGWVLSVFGLSSECLSLIVTFFVFKLTVPITISTIKLAIRWYDKLKP